MLKLKLIKGGSYTGYGVTASTKNPFIVVDKKDVYTALIASGYFSAVECPVVESHVDANHEAEKSFEKMTEKELNAYAAKNGISLAGISKKADKLAAIQRAVSAENDTIGLFDTKD